MPHYERIDESEQFDGRVRDSHEIRYKIASLFLGDSDSVIDACCGTGYGEQILLRGRILEYHGIDKNPPNRPEMIQLDFEEDKIDWNYLVNEFDIFQPDLFVGLECIEHLNNDGVKNFVKVAQRAKKYIIISTPIKPNSNPFHKQQFTKEEIVVLFTGGESTFELQHYFEQDDLYGLFIFKNLKSN